ncbi:MAG: O-antigen ligase family protein [Candidatus Omnitrophota bacterium]
MLLAAITFSTSLVEIAASVMILAWLAKKACDPDFKFLNYVPVMLIIAFFAWTVLSCFNSEYFKESFRGVFKVLEYAMIFIIAVTSLDEEKILKRSLVVIASTAVIICASGFFQYFAGFDFIRQRPLIPQDGLHRVSSSFIHPNDFGVYLAVVSLLFISFLFSSSNKLRNRLLLLVPLAFSLASLYLTKSRGAWISFSAGFLVLGALRSKRMAAIFLAALLVIFIMLPTAAQERVFNLVDFKEGTTWERVMLWKGTINMIKAHPVLGFGVNTYSRNFPDYKPPDYPDYRYSHNSYLQMASEVGIVGALLFLVFLSATLIYALKGISKMTSDQGLRKDYARGLFAGLVGFSLNSLVDTHLYSVNPAVFFYLLLGFCFSISLRAQKE